MLSLLLPTWLQNDVNPSLLFAEKVVVSTSCSLLHTAVDLVNEIKLDKELKSWLAFAAQKVVEVNALAKSFSGTKDEVHLCLVALCTTFEDIIWHMSAFLVLEDL